MAYSERWARKMLRELPKNPQEILIPGGRNYSDPTFLKLFFEHLDQLIYEDPRLGLSWAEVVLQLTVSSPATLQFKAHTTLGSAFRAAGQPDDAEEQYRIAQEIAESEGISWELRADLSRQFANLRVCQRRPEEALDLISKLDGLEGISHWKIVLSRGYALGTMQRFSEAVDCFGQVLEGINLKGISNAAASSPEKRTQHAAAVNLGYVFKEEVGPASSWTALGYVAKAKQLLPIRPSLPLYQLVWIEGLIWYKLWRYETPTGFPLAHEAEQALKRALHGFLHLRTPWEIALIGLDLAQLYRDLDRWDDLLSLAVETLHRFKILSGNTEVVVSLGLIVNAVRARENVEAAILAAQKVVRKKRHTSRKQPHRSWVGETSSSWSIEPPPPVGRSNLAMIETRHKLLKAAYEEIGGGFKVDAILKRAGVNRNKFYHHFDSHGGCAIAVVEEYMHTLVLNWLRRVAPTDPLESLANLVVDDPPFLQLPNKLATDRLEKLCQLWRMGLAEKLNQGQQEGTVRSNIDAQEIAAYIIPSFSDVVLDTCRVPGFLWFLETLKPTSENQDAHPLADLDVDEPPVDM